MFHVFVGKRDKHDTFKRMIKLIIMDKIGTIQYQYLCENFVSHRNKNILSTSFDLTVIHQ